MFKVSVLMVDSYRLVREGLRRLLEASGDIIVIGEAENGEAAVEMCQKVSPDVVLMGISMSNMDGIEATHKIKGTCPGVGVIVIASHEDDEHLFWAVKAGAGGYISKDEGPDKLIEAVKAVSRGEEIIDSAAYRRAIEGFSHFNEKNKDRNFILSSLTKTERKIIKALVGAKPNKEIARQLSLSEKTVKNYLTNIYQKLHVNNRAQAILKIFNLKLVENRRVKNPWHRD